MSVFTKVTAEGAVFATFVAICLATLPGNLLAQSGTINYIQGNYATPQSAPTSVSVGFTAAQAAGDLNVVVVGWNDATATVTGVTDSRGNTYALAVGPTVLSGIASQSIYYAKNIQAAAAGANTVTVAFSRAATFPDIRIAEYSGADANNPVDVTAAATGSSTTSNSGSATTTNATDLLFGANLVQTNTTGPGSSFTQRLLTKPDGDIAEDRMVTSTGSYTATASVKPSGQWIMQMVAFRTPPVGPDTQPPTTPGTLTANATSSSQINLSWQASTDNVGVTGYLVERCQGPGCSGFAQVGTSPSATYSDSTVMAGTSYSYRVRATDAAGNLSQYSNAASATTPTPDTQPPIAPSNLTAAAISATQVNLSWTASTDNVGVTGYLVERCQGAACSTFTQVGTSPSAAFSDSGLTAGTNYTYRVRATDAAGNLSGYSATASATTPTTISGLVAAYAFDEGTGTTVLDVSGTGNNGTISSATWTTSAKYGNALIFNGSNALVTIPDAASLHLTAGMTLEAWVKPSTVDGAWRDVVYKGNDNYYLEGTSTSGSAPAAGGTFGTASANVFGTSALVANTWTHLASTYDGATLRLYVNGAQVSSVARTGTLASSTNALQVGGDSLYGQYFAGTIDEVRVYNVALTPAQIQSDMNTPIGSAADTLPPTAPTNLSATAVSPSQVNLNWVAATDNVGVANYLIESCLTASCTYAQIGTTTSTTFSNTSLNPGTGYSYRVRAADAAGNLSAYSNVASATTPFTDTEPPTAPSNLNATATSPSQISLTWTASTDNVGLHGYSIERCVTASCTFAVVAPYVTSTVYTDVGLNPSTSYSYRVDASDSAGNISGYSNVASATTSAVDTQPPSAPTNLTAIAAGATEIDLTWGASSDNTAVTAYLLERCQGSNCVSFSQIASISGLAYADAGLTAGVSYTYRVRATDAAGNLSTYSSSATASTPALPTGLVAAYGFSEGTGTTTADASGNGLTGALQNTSWTMSGQHGTALTFNGTSSFVDLGTMSAFPLTSSATWSAWVFPTANPSDDGQIIAKSSGSDGWQLKTTPDTGRRTFGVGVSNGTTIVQRYSATQLSLNTWYYVAGVYNAASQTLDIYVNGVLDNGTLAGTVPASQNNPGSINTNIGRRQGGYYFIGTIDDVRIYSRALSATEIQVDMSTAVGSSVAVPLVTLSSTTASFGNQATGTTSPPQAVTMTNSGGQPLSIGSISVTGANTGDFNETNDCPPTVQPSAGCTINIVFQPTATGTRSAVIAITDNAPGSPHTISLTGTGVGFGVSPRVSVLTSTITQQFTASNGSGTVTWLVDNSAGGSTSSGTITSSGLYTPPSTAGIHTVSAQTSTGQSASATVYISNYAGVSTMHNDNLRTGQNLNETVLTQANVTSTQFGKLFSYPLDGGSHASPLYVSSVSIPGLGMHNVVYVATEHDTLYAFDADGRSTSPLWQVSFINPGAGITTIPATDTGETGDINPEVGITSTPVIDSTSGTIYVVAATKEVSGGNTTYRHRLHALDLATGAEKFGGPVVIQASVAGTGAGSSGGAVPFNSLRENQRPALLLSNGAIYLAFASHGDQAPYHGWVLGYNATTLQQTMAYCDSPNGSQAGIWQSGMGPAADAAGNVYVMTANGTFNANTGGTEYGDSFLKLSPAGTVLDYFTPKDQAIMNSNNWDLASSGTLLLPDQPGATPHLLLSAGKTGTVYLVNRDNMGHFTSTDSQIVQALYNIFPNGTPEPGNYSAPVYFNGKVYFGPINDRLQAFQLTSGLLSTAPTSASTSVYSYPGATLSVSANGSSNGIVWAIQRNDSATTEPSSSAATLHAYSAGDLSMELYNSDQAGARDTFSSAAKMTVPVIANGRVYVVSQGQLTAFGLLP